MFWQNGQDNETIATSILGPVLHTQIHCFSHNMMYNIWTADRLSKKENGFAVILIIRHKFECSLEMALTLIAPNAKQPGLQIFYFQIL